MSHILLECPSSIDPFYIVSFYIKWVTIYYTIYVVSFYIKWVTTSWTRSTFHFIIARIWFDSWQLDSFQVVIVDNRVKQNYFNEWDINTISPLKWFYFSPFFFAWSSFFLHIFLAFSSFWWTGCKCLYFTVHTSGVH